MAEKMKVMPVSLKKIEQNENSRVVYKKADLSELMYSMRQRGLLQPVGVMPIKGTDKFEAVYGNRRIQAAKNLDWDVIDAVIVDPADETERDILNLTENIKRQNTSVGEEGRMYIVLRDRGLTVDEIAARLDVNKVRIENAIETYQHVPKDILPKIVNRVSGSKKKGTISATSVHAAHNLRKSHGLNRQQFRSLLNYAGTDRASVQHMQKIAPLLKQGVSVKQAINVVGNMDRFVLTVFLPHSRVEKLEKKYNKSIQQLLYAQLEKNTEFKVSREIDTAYRPGKKHETRKVILRKASAEKAAS